MVSRGGRRKDVLLHPAESVYDSENESCIVSAR